jgi:hypothetical protein
MNLISNIARSRHDPKIVRSGPGSLDDTDRLARGLGWFSIGLGLAELVAPRRFTRALGMRGREGLVRACGAREIASGILCLAPEKEAGLSSRLVGDGLDVATLLGAFRSDNPKKDNVAVALLMVGGITLLDLVGRRGIEARHARHRGRRRLYNDRTGFPKGVEAAKGAARDFRALPDMRARGQPV